MSKVKALKAAMSAFFAVEIYGEGATTEHAENLVYVSDDGSVLDLDEMVVVLIEAARSEEGFEDLTDEQIAEHLLVRMGTAGRAEA